MAPTRAVVTIRNGVTYINDADVARMYLTELLRRDGKAEQQNHDSDMEEGLVQDFKQRVRAVAGEVGSQIAMSVATGEPFSTGGKAYRAARTVAPLSAENIHRSTRASGAAKHDLTGVCDHVPSTAVQQANGNISDATTNDDGTAVGAIMDHFFVGDHFVDAGTQTDETVAQQTASIGNQAVEHEIYRETERTRPDWSFRDESQKRVDEHKARYPGGTLPMELRDVEKYIAGRKGHLSASSQRVPTCMFCGKT